MIPQDERKAVALLKTRGYRIIKPLSEAHHNTSSTSEEVISAIVGSRASLAEIVGVSRAAVYKWREIGSIPAVWHDKLKDWANRQDEDIKRAIYDALGG